MNKEVNPFPGPNSMYYMWECLPELICSWMRAFFEKRVATAKGVCRTPEACGSECGRIMSNIMTFSRRGILPFC